MANDKGISRQAIAKIAVCGSYREGDTHQAILDIAYDDWQRRDGQREIKVKSIDIDGTAHEYVTTMDLYNKIGSGGAVHVISADPDRDFRGWNYFAMVEHARELYGPTAAAFILVGKYNQQVCNGGHIQYYDNGYCDASRGGGGCFSEHDPEIPLHAMLLDLFDEYVAPLARTERQRAVIEKARNIMGRFEVDVYESNPRGGYRYEDDDEESEYRDGEVMNTHMLSALDTQYYEICDEFMDVLNDLAFEAIAIAE